MRLGSLVLLSLVASLAISAGAEKLSVAAAANLSFALEELHPAFRKLEPAVTLELVTGASGNLVNQIRNGAPYEVFLSADMAFPQTLVASGHAVADSLAPFAVGRLVLWTTRENLRLTAIADLRAPAVTRLALATPETAPYGHAAKEALTKLGLWDELAPKIVLGENITQTAQYVETGNADAGFVALSLVLSPRLRNRGRWIEVPAELHAPLEQGAVITKRGASHVAARRYLDFLRGAEAQEILMRFGYVAPAVVQ